MSRSEFGSDENAKVGGFILNDASNVPNESEVDDKWRGIPSLEILLQCIVTTWDPFMVQIKVFMADSDRIMSPQSLTF